MVDDPLSEPEELKGLISQLEDVSRLPPREALHYVLALSEAVLALYVLMRDSLPRSYGRIKFSRFVELKRRQVENMRSICLELFPDTSPSRAPTPPLKARVETVGDYARVLKKAIFLESLILRALRYLAEKTDEKLLFSDLAREVESNIDSLKTELKRVESAESKVHFSEFVKELVGDKDGRV